METYLETCIRHLSVFFNTDIQNDYTSFACSCSHTYFSPIRYFFSGTKVLIQQNGRHELVHSVPSYHAQGAEPYHSRSYNYEPSPFGPARPFFSDEESMCKTAFYIAAFVPGLIFGIIFKLFSYLFEDVRERHNLIYEHSTPIPRWIGSDAHPITTQAELEAALRNELVKFPDYPTKALIITGYNPRGNGVLQIDGKLDDLRRLDPQRLILVNANINVKYENGDPTPNSFDAQLDNDHAWAYRSGEPLDRCADLHEAENKPQPRKSWFTTFKTVHQVITQR